MDLIRNDQDIILDADFSHPQQIATRKDDPQRIMRVAQQEHPYFLNLFSESIPVNFITQDVTLHTFNQRRVELRDTHVILYLMEFIIDRRLNEISLFGRTERARRHVESADNARYRDN